MAVCLRDRAQGRAVHSTYPPEFLERYKHALTLFVAGRFEQARESIDALLEWRPDEPALVEKRIQIDLLDNRPLAALERLRRSDDPEDPLWPGLWGVAYLRSGSYRLAAPYFDMLGQHARAAVFERLDDQRPADPQAGAEAPFRQHRPMPVIAVKVDGEEDALLALDTGAGETLLDTGLADRLGLSLGEPTRALFAGGMPAEVRYAAVDSIAVGDVELGPLPVQVMDIQATLPGFFGPHGVDGMLGIQALWQHDVVFDFPDGRLVLLPQGRLGTTPGNSTRCWLAGESHLVARGSLNDYSLMWFLDSGMVGFECLLPEATVAAWRLPVSRGTHEAWGGGGVVEVHALRAERLCLGGICRRDVTGVVMPQFPLETAYGFHLGGVIAGDFLGHFRLEIDFRRMAFRLQP